MNRYVAAGPSLAAFLPSSTAVPSHSRKIGPDFFNRIKFLWASPIANRVELDLLWAVSHGLRLVEHRLALLLLYALRALGRTV
jgi:hypothetical protein